MFVIAAVDQEYGIGLRDAIPWSCPEDMRWYSYKTKGCALLVGRATWDTLPDKAKTGRSFFVVTSADRTDQENVMFCKTPEAAMAKAKHTGKRVGCIGGGALYKWAMTLADTLYLSCIRGNFKCDTFFPQLYDKPYFLRSSESLSPDCVLQTWKRSNIDRDYLDLLQHVMEHGALQKNRTSVMTRNITGAFLECDLAAGFPLLTTKRVFWRGVVEELLWFLRGSTCSKELEDKGVNIWRNNTTREFLDSRGLSYVEGELGPGYGFQWRFSGCEYPSREGGTDQIAEAIRLLQEDSCSRRIIVSAWNVADLHKMALPPCHMMFQFCVQDGRLCCVVTQRSADMFLGVPFNIASYALLTHIMARRCGFPVGTLRLNFGSCHLYNNHVDAALTQLKREARSLPTLTLSGDDRMEPWDYTPEHIKLEGYKPHKRIAATMVV